MFQLFEPLKKLLTLDDVITDNVVFVLHYKLTVIFLVASCLVVTGGQYIGDPIDCMVEGIPPNLMDSYCWVHSTFSAPSEKEGSEELQYHRYYQWVGFFLFFQACLFYVPRYIWSNWEGGRMKGLVQNLTEPIAEPEERKLHLIPVVNYFMGKLHGNDLYFWRFFLCALLNFFHVTAEIYLMDVFFLNSFTKHGFALFSDALSIRVNERGGPMNRVFPITAKCHLNTYGPSGTVQRHDSLCVLTLNVLTEKITAISWIWFMILSFLSLLDVFSLLAVLCFQKVRLCIFRMTNPKVSFQKLRKLNDKLKIGDWFLLYQVGKTMDFLAYQELVDEISDRL